jgi:DNA-binding beta-propeller fold protein YncE
MTSQINNDRLVAVEVTPEERKPRNTQTHYSISVLTLDSSESGLRELQEYMTSTLETRGLAYLPTLHRTSETNYVVVSHLPSTLQRGDLLVTDQATFSVKLVRDGVARPYLDLSSWCNAHVWSTAVSPDYRHVYVSMSGMRGPISDKVGLPGTSAVLEIDTETGKLTRAITGFRGGVGMPYDDKFIDLAGIVVSPDGRYVYGCDFNNWQGNGKVVSVDLETGAIDVVTDGLDQPSTLSLDGPYHLLVANTRQPHGKASGGQVIRVDTRSGAKTQVAEVTGVDASLIGVVRLESGAFVASMSEGTQDLCFVAKIEPDGQTWRRIWHPEPGFIGSGIFSDGKHIWVAETLRARVYELDADGNPVRFHQIHDNVDLANPSKMIRGFDSLEAVTVLT